MLQLGVNNWTKMVMGDRQKKLKELRMAEKKLREDGNMDEAVKLLGELKCTIT